MAGRTAAPVSVVILTMNEAANIGDCVAACLWSDDVHVVDSGSTDRTVEIARRSGAHVHVHAFESFGSQRNWAIDHIALKHEWVFHLDADERFTPELVSAIANRLEGEPRESGFYVPEKCLFMGRWLKRAAGYPKYQMRLFHKARMRFRDYGHGQRELTAGALGTLNEPYLHFAFSKGITDWLDKHNRYSTLEASRIAEGAREPWSLLHLISRDRVRRRRAAKELAHHVPFRPLVRRFVTLFLMGGILEGEAGRTYARLVALYEEMIDVKLRLLRHGRAASKETEPAIHGVPPRNTSA